MLSKVGTNPASVEPYTVRFPTGPNFLGTRRSYEKN